MQHFVNFDIPSMNNRQIQTLLNFFEEVIFVEESLDICKSNLIALPNFNPNDLFDFVAAGNCSITIQRLRKYLEGKLNVNQSELYQVFVKFDWRRQGQISRLDFIKEIFPYNHHKKMKINVDKKSISAPVQNYFLQLINIVAKGHRSLEIWRKQLINSKPYEFFSQIDWRKSGIIGLRALSRIFMSYHKQKSDQKIKILLHGLKRRYYGEVNLQVFCENLKPLEFGHYLAYNFSLSSQINLTFLKRNREIDNMKVVRQQEETRLRSNLLHQEVRNQAELIRKLQIENLIYQQSLVNDALTLQTKKAHNQALLALHKRHRSLAPSLKDKELSGQVSSEREDFIKTARKQYVKKMNKINVHQRVASLHKPKVDEDYIINKQNQGQTINSCSSTTRKSAQNSKEGNFFHARLLEKRIAQTKMEYLQNHLQCDLNRDIENQIYKVYTCRSRYN